MSVQRIADEDGPLANHKGRGGSFTELGRKGKNVSCCEDTWYEFSREKISAGDENILYFNNLQSITKSTDFTHRIKRLFKYSVCVTVYTCRLYDADIKQKGGNCYNRKV